MFNERRMSRLQALAAEKQLALELRRKDYAVWFNRTPLYRALVPQMLFNSCYVVAVGRTRSSAQLVYRDTPLAGPVISLRFIGNVNRFWINRAYMLLSFCHAEVLKSKSHRSSDGLDFNNFYVQTGKIVN
jgi:hypothetical protein